MHSPVQYSTFLTYLFDECQTVSLAICLPQIRGRATAPQLATLQDGDAIAEHLSLIEVVSGKDQCATCVTKIGTCLQILVSRETPHHGPLALRKYVFWTLKNLKYRTQTKSAVRITN